MSPDHILDIIASHERWLQRRTGGTRANLSGCNLADFNLAQVNLQSAKL